ncbi:MAG: DUF5684 domain-containing protein [Lachnospiraceae bacterium]
MESYWATLGLFLLIVGLVFLFIVILVIAAVWKIFSKAGKPGWAAIIPIYSTYIMSDIIFGNASYFAIWIGACVLSIIAQLTGISILTVLTSLVSIVLCIVVSVKLAKAFGKDTGFMFGLILLPIIFYPILGFGNAEYIGPDNQIIPLQGKE